MVVATWTLPYNGDELILTERHSEAVVAANRAAGIDIEPYVMYERGADGNIEEHSTFDSIEQAEDFVEEICYEIERAYHRDLYLTGGYSIKDEIEEVRQQNIDDMFDRWLDKYEDIL